MYSSCNFGACYQLAQSVLKIGFSLTGIGGGGRVSAWGAMHMAAALAGCRKALVGTGWAISLLFDTNGRRYRVHSVLAAVFINPLTTECTRHATLGVEFSKSVTNYFDVQLNESFSV